VQSCGERLVLERVERLEAADGGVDVGAHGERGAGEVVVLRVRVGGVEMHEAPSRLRPAALADARWQECELRGVELDHAADRLCSVARVGELSREPVGLRAGVGIGRDDKAVGPSGGEQRRSRQLHPGSARGPGARAGPIDQLEREAVRGGDARGDLAGRVSARVEHDDDCEARRVAEALRRKGAEARADPRGLVAGGYDDDGVEVAAHQLAPAAISSRPRS
jgi:hypothetical protein